MHAFRFTLSLGLAVFGLTNRIHAQAADPASRGPVEKRALFSSETAKVWYAAESTTEASAAHVKDAAQALHWHVTVDHHAGEPKYPVGWPRFGRGFTSGPQQEWTGWDYLHGWIFTETSRAELPRMPLGVNLSAAGSLRDEHHPVENLKKGAWTELLIPISQFNESAALERVQFNISESNYNHGDTLDLHVSGLTLLRFAAPTLLAFAPESAVMFAGARTLPVTAQLAGVKTGAACEFSCELRKGAAPVTRLTTQAVRGVQRLALDLAGRKLEPGDYELVATLAGSAKPVTAKLRLVESPWK